MTEPTLIEAAGGVVWRPGANGQREIAIVHRPRYDDWSLPKGKLKRGEHVLVAAVREVAEETCVRAIPQFPLPRIRYRSDGSPKQVNYWAMVADQISTFQPDSEVDGIAWLPVPAAIDRLTYQHDAELVRDWAGRPAVTGLVLLVRHADAGARWSERDGDRPLSQRGEADAAALCRLLALFDPDRLVSASVRRCQQTLAPLAERCDRSIEVGTVFDELTNDPDAAAAAVRAYAAAGNTTVICSQRTVIPPVLARLTGDPDRDWRTEKGDGWLLPYAGERPIAAVPLNTQRVRR
ncbi:MAG TPA: NUDIX domain-containing protein [Natronosporangium sp.]